MSAGVYANINGVTRKGKKLYAKVNGVVRPIKELWVKDNGVARKIYQACPKVINTEYDYTDSSGWNCREWQNNYEVNADKAGYCRIFPAFDKAFTVKHVILYGSALFGPTELPENDGHGGKNQILFDLYATTNHLVNLTLTADGTHLLSGQNEADCDIHVGANSTGYIKFEVRANAYLSEYGMTAYIYAEVITDEFGAFIIPMF